MNINRTNYEEYFLLAIDKELDQSGMLELELFVNENPDLRLEWEALCSSILLEENSISFNDKSMLHAIPQKEQLQETMILLLDNEVSPEQRLHTLQLMATDIKLQNEFKLLQNAKLADEIECEYPWKQELYKKETRKLYPFYLRIAAAVIFISATTLFYLANNDSNSSKKSLAGNIQSKSIGKSPIVETKPMVVSHTPLPNETINSSINNQVKHISAKKSQTIVEEITEMDTKMLPHLQTFSSIALQAPESSPATNKAIISTTLLNSEFQNPSIASTAYTPVANLESNLAFQEEENSPVQIFITDTNKRNKTRALVRKLVRFAGKAAELVTASAHDENAIQIASFEIPRK